MAALPYMQLYVADYLADTIHLTAEEHGAYILLLMNYWQTGKPLPKSRLQSISRVPNERWTDVQQTLNEFFYDDGTTWSHERVDRDLESVRKKTKQRSEAGKASAKARKTKANEQPLNDRSTKGSNGRSTNKDTDTDTDNRHITLSSESVSRAREAPPPPASKKGTRLTEDWRPPPEWIDYAVNHGFSKQEAQSEADRFRDYWIARPGKNGLKLDWLATWRNWIRRASDFGRSSGAHGSGREKQSGVVDPVEIGLRLVREAEDENDFPSYGQI